MRALLAAAVIAASFAGLTLPALALGGGLNAQGCLNNRKTGDEHCHGGGGATRAAARSLRQASGGAFVNCTAARAAGAAPVRRGDPGYGAHLDRDGDGIGCE
jgi:hypothetical protein